MQVAPQNNDGMRTGASTNQLSRAGARRERGSHGREVSGLTYARIVDQVTRTGVSQSELAEALGTSVRTVQNWAVGHSTPRGDSREKLLDVQFLIDELRDVYTDEGIGIWLRARNRNLGGARPVELITDGHFDQVLEEAQRLAGAM